MSLLLVMLGGAIGSGARYLIAGFVHRFASPFFPFGTFAVNLAGCLVFGAVAGLAAERFVGGPQARTFLLVGVLGGFTTFSTFAFETSELLWTGQFMRAGLNAGGQIVAGLLAVWAGYQLSRLL